MKSGSEAPEMAADNVSDIQNGCDAENAEKSEPDAGPLICTRSQAKRAAASASAEESTSPSELIRY